MREDPEDSSLQIDVEPEQEFLQIESPPKKSLVCRVPCEFAEEVPKRGLPQLGAFDRKHSIGRGVELP